MADVAQEYAEKAFEFVHRWDLWHPAGTTLSSIEVVDKLRTMFVKYGEKPTEHRLTADQVDWRGEYLRLDRVINAMRAALAL